MALPGGKASLKLKEFPRKMRVWLVVWPSGKPDPDQATLNKLVYGRRYRST
jgi:hypothetical protein